MVLPRVGLRVYLLLRFVENMLTICHKVRISYENCHSQFHHGAKNRYFRCKFNKLALSSYCVSFMESVTKILQLYGITARF